MVGFDDDQGTYLIRITNVDTVYVVVGICESIHAMVEHADSAFHGFPLPAIQATFLPFYSRLVSDGVLLATTRMPVSREQFLATLEQAKEQGRVVSCLRQLQVHDGSLKV